SNGTDWLYDPDTKEEDRDNIRLKFITSAIQRSDFRAPF
ncbi:hypothetical protein L915_06220, partial [Phytophthora nicotianae]